MRAPWATELDERGAVELGRLEALIEALDGAIRASKGKPKRDLLSLRLRATKELREWLAVYGLLPHARASWAAALGGTNLAADIARRRREAAG